MPNLKEVRIRIASVESTKQITSAMKLVSASKLRRAQDAILKMRPYAKKLQEILTNLSSSLENKEENIYGVPREIKKVLIVPIASNRGLCGPFNANVMKATVNHIKSNYSSLANNGDVHIITIGKKTSDFFAKQSIHVVSSHNEIFNSLDFDSASQITEKLMRYYKAGIYDRIDIVYNCFKNAATHVLEIEQFLPVDLSSLDDSNHTTDYIFEPGKQQIIFELIPKSLKVQFYKALLDSHAAEHGARMTAMHKATDNAIQLLKDLKLSYNKARQASITKEILEIVSGAEALKG